MNEKINVGILGLGHMGKTHVGAAIASPWVDEITGFDPDKGLAASVAEEFEVKVADSADEILNDPAIKLIYIATPNGTHVDLTERAMRAGKAVMCEKPMGENLADAKRMVDVEKETGQFLQLGFELRYSKMYAKVKEWIDQGLIGTPVNSHCRYYASEFHCKDTWRSNSPGSLIGEKLSHYLDGQRWWINSPVVEVYSMNAPNVVEYFNHPDNHQINLRFANGAISNVNFNMFLPETDAGDPLLDVMDKQSDDGHCLQYHVFGTKGGIETDVFRRRIRRWEFSDSPKQLVSKIVETVTFTKEDDNAWFHNVHDQNIRISELVAKGLPPENNIRDSYETMRVCFAAEVSEKEHRVVTLDSIQG